MTVPSPAHAVPEAWPPPGPADVGWLPVDLGPGVDAGFVRTNVSLVVGDLEVARRTRTVLAEAFGTVRFVRQVHGTGVHEVGTDPGAAPEVGREPEADAVVAGPGVAVGVLVADCVPVLLADPVAKVVGAVHAGRRGLLAGVVEAALAAVAARGSRPEDLRAVVGPAICGQCYEVPADVRDEVAAVVPGTASTTSWGTPALDLPAGVRHRLAAAGVADVTDLGMCTLTDGAWFSHRAWTARDRPPGRLAGVVRLRTPRPELDDAGRVGPGGARPAG